MKYLIIAVMVLTVAACGATVPKDTSSCTRTVGMSKGGIPFILGESCVTMPAPTIVAVDVERGSGNDTVSSHPNPTSTPDPETPTSTPDPETPTSTPDPETPTSTPDPTPDAPKPEQPTKIGCNGSNCGEGSGRGASEGNEQSRNDND